MIKINKTYTATTLEVKIINDNLIDTAHTYWEIKDENGKVLECGNTTISGDDYKNWDNSNKMLYTLIGEKLDLLSNFEK